MSVQVINLNPAKKGADSHYHKLEIPIALAPPVQAPADSAKNPFCLKFVQPLVSNSNV